MKRYIVAAVLIVGFTTPVLADAFYVMLDNTTHKCSIAKTPPTDTEKFSMMGQYGSEAEAMSAMHKMAKCKG